MIGIAKKQDYHTQSHCYCKCQEYVWQMHSYVWHNARQRQHQEQPYKKAHACHPAIPPEDFHTFQVLFHTAKRHGEKKLSAEAEPDKRN